MSFSVKFTQSGPALSSLGKQVSYALALSINRTLEEARDRGRQRIYQVLTVRSGTTGRFLEGLVDVRTKAKRDSLHGVLSVEDPAFGKSRRGAGFILIKHETGGTFTRDADQNPFAVPTSALRPSRSSVIPRSLYPTALGFSRTGFTIPVQDFHRAKQHKGGVVLRGKARTFAVDRRFHPLSPINTRGVWQRRGRGSGSDTTLLWHYTNRITLPPRLGFMKTANRVIEQQLAPNFAGFLNLALRTAR